MGSPPAAHAMIQTMKWEPFKRLLLAAGTVAAVLTAMSRVPAGMYVITPGKVLPVSPLVSVEGTSPGTGRFLMTTVAAAEASVTDLLAYAFDRTAGFIPRPGFLSAGRSREDFLEDVRREMEESQTVAAYVALRHVGREAGLSGRGVRVLGVAGESPAAGVLGRGDVIVAAAGRPVRFIEDIPPAAESVRDGLVLTVLRGGERRQVTLPSGARWAGAWRAGPGAGRNATGQPPLPGVEAVTEGLEADFPVRITFSPSGVVGPSAGLAFTLEVIDRLEPSHDLAAGRTVATTGAVWPSGRVVPVGGVRQKVVAARRAGADVILVPAADAAEARAAAGPLRVFPVDTVADAVRALRALGR